MEDQLEIHCGYLDIETIVPLFFFNDTNEYKVVNNYIVLKNPRFSNLDNVNNF
jgi:hypothetical protein